MRAVLAFYIKNNSTISKIILTEIILLGMNENLSLRTVENETFSLAGVGDDSSFGCHVFISKRGRC